MATETSVLTGTGRLSYSHIHEAHSSKPEKPKKFSTAFLWPKSDTVATARIQKAVDAAMNAGITAKWGGKKPGKLKLPIRDGDDPAEEKEDDPAYAGMYFLNASSNNKPGIVEKGKSWTKENPCFLEITDKQKVYSGCYCVLDINFFPFDVDGSKGVAGGLNNVLFIRDGEALAGGRSAEAAFAGVAFEDGDTSSEDDDMM
jgi:hypothetical protein